MLSRTPRAIRFAALVALLAIAAWCVTRSKHATVQISPTAYATFESKGIYQWFSLYGLPLIYFENGKAAGEVRFTYGPQTNPLGIFPGPDSNTLICVYETDLTLGVFAVELDKR